MALFLGGRAGARLSERMAIGTCKEALDPTELQRLVLAAVAPYIDQPVLADRITEEERQRRQLRAFAFAGSLVDRWGAGRVFRMSNLVRTVMVVLAGAVLLALPSSGTMTTCVVLAFGAVSGLLAEISFVAVETLGAEVSRRMGGAAHRVQSVQTGIDQGAMLAGPLLGGLLLAGPAVLLAVVALLALTAAATTSGDTGNTVHRPVSSSLLTGWETLRRTPALAWLVGGLAASNLTTGVLQAAAPITVIHHFHYSTASVGSVWSAAAVVSLAAVWASRHAIDRSADAPRNVSVCFPLGW
ncbi:MFS transporter [Streptomyces sp. Wh19]|uniref:MFS transporter n=1 Tax=Streptomyces sanglieri TaxID=193460 RepID=A0ABW2WP01_9ACTN|nr:MFS transporter [Streptomyces sp. Wh19]MDV9200783.1 hypothetical protein [Streptomyces sp. Wh19]